MSAEKRVRFEPGDRVIDMRDGSKQEVADVIGGAVYVPSRVGSMHLLRHDVSTLNVGTAWTVGSDSDTWLEVVPARGDTPAWLVMAYRDAGNHEDAHGPFDSGRDALRVACAIAAGRWS